MAKYAKTSPWSDTRQNNFYLDLLEIRPVQSEPDDFRYVIENQYRHRPDLLAYDLYGIAGLWWVFYQRNPNTLTAPPLDFKADTRIYIPKITTLRSTLGF
jgi:hypothetical protein